MKERGEEMKEERKKEFEKFGKSLGFENEIFSRMECVFTQFAPDGKVLHHWYKVKTPQGLWIAFRDNPLEVVQSFLGEEETMAFLDEQWESHRKELEKGKKFVEDYKDFPYAGTRIEQREGKPADMSQPHICSSAKVCKNQGECYHARPHLPRPSCYCKCHSCPFCEETDKNIPENAPPLHEYCY